MAGGRGAMKKEGVWEGGRVARVGTKGNGVGGKSPGDGKADSRKMLWRKKWKEGGGGRGWGIRKS